MMDLSTLREVIDFIDRWQVIVWMAVIPATLFPILYAWWFPFHKSTLGLALFIKALGLMLLVDTTVAYTFLDVNGDTKEYISIIVTLIILIGMWWQLIAISKIRLEDRVQHEAEKFDDDHRDGHTMDRPEGTPYNSA